MDLDKEELEATKRLLNRIKKESKLVDEVKNISLRNYLKQLFNKGE